MQWQRNTQFLRYTFLVLALVIARVIPSTACDVFPMEIGTSWSYMWSAGGSGTFSMEVIGTTFINGYEVFDIQEEYDYNPDGISHSYYSLNEDDGVLFHGWVNDLSSYAEHLFSPPIIDIECPLVVGNTWHTSSAYYDNFEGVGAGQLVAFQFEVRAYEQIITPAGDFFAYLVVRSSNPGEGELWRWYAPGLGMIKYSFIYYGNVLASYSLLDHEVLVEPTTWGGLKACFR